MSNCHQIVPFLFQGSAPPLGDEIKKKGFQCLILCAEEFQPAATSFPGVEVIHAPNDDADRLPTAKELQFALVASRKAYRKILNAENVLVTCMQGRNRSGLVTALTLHHLYGWDGDKCINHVKTIRPNSMTNEHFNKIIRKVTTIRV